MFGDGHGSSALERQSGRMATSGPSSPRRERRRLARAPQSTIGRNAGLVVDATQPAATAYSGTGYATVHYDAAPNGIHAALQDAFDLLRRRSPDGNAFPDLLGAGGPLDRAPLSDGRYRVQMEAGLAGVASREPSTTAPSSAKRAPVIEPLSQPGDRRLPPVLTNIGQRWCADHGFKHCRQNMAVHHSSPTDEGYPRVRDVPPQPAGGRTAASSRWWSQP